MTQLHKHLHKRTRAHTPYGTQIPLLLSILPLALIFSDVLSTEDRIEVLKYTHARTWAKIRDRVCASAHLKTRTNIHNYRCTSRSYQTQCSKDLNRGVYVHTNSYFLNFWKYTHKIVRALSEFCSIQRCWWRRRLPALSVRGIYYKLSFLRPSPEGLCACVLV